MRRGAFVIFWGLCGAWAAAFMLASMPVLAATESTDWVHSTLEVPKVRAKFAPPPEHLLHFAGTPAVQPASIAPYTAMTGPELAPAGQTMWIDIPGTRSWLVVRDRFAQQLQALATSGSAVNLGLGFENGKRDGFGTAADDAVATTTDYDSKIDDVALAIRQAGLPVFLRIGVEVNGAWSGLHAYVFPRAYRKIVERFRALKVDNVAFVWCVEPDGDARIDEHDPQGHWRWFPGEDVVDWYGVDVFAGSHFDGTMAATVGGQRSPYGVTQRLLDMARQARKPVMIGETTPYRVNLKPDAMDPRFLHAQEAWLAWFGPFLRWIDHTPEIQAVTILPVDWRQVPGYTEWGDSRLYRSSWIAQQWKLELTKARWVHAPQLHEAITPPDK